MSFPRRDRTSYINLNKFGIPANTSFDISERLRHAFDTNPNAHLVLPKGQYIYDATLGPINLQDGHEFTADGDATLLIRGNTGTLSVFRPTGDTMQVLGVRLLVDSDNAGDASYICFRPANGARNLILDLEIDGDMDTGGTSVHHVFGVSPESAANVQGIWFEGEWHHCSRAWLKINTDVGEQNMLRFTNRLYLHDMMAEPLAFNTPAGRVYDIVLAHTSRDVWDPTVGHIAIGSSEGCIISAKVFGKGKRAFHLEEGVRRAQFIAASCEMTDAAAVGIFFADNNVHLATQPIDVLVQSCLLRGPGQTSVGSIGFQLSNDATTRGPVNGLLFRNNTIEDWERGLSGDDLALNTYIEENSWRRCGTSFYVPAAVSTGITFLRERVNRNRMEDCPIPFDTGSGSELFWGSENRAGFDEFMGATLWATGTAYKVEDVVSSVGLKYRSLTVHTSGVTAPADDPTNWVLVDRWTNSFGSSPGSIAHFTSLVRLTTGASASANYAANGVQRAVTGPYLKPSLAPIRIGFRIKSDLITAMAFTCGLTDDAAFEESIAINATTVQTNAATDAVAFHFQTGVTVPNWQGLGVKAGVSATPLNTGVVPVAATNQFLEVALDMLGNATLYVNGVSVGTIANAVSPTALLTPFVNGKAKTTVARLIDYEACFLKWGA